MTVRNVRLRFIPSASQLSGAPPFHSAHIPVLFSQGLIMNDDAPGFVISFLTGRCSLPLLVPCFAACLSLCPIHPLTLSDSRPHDDPLMCVETGARSGRRDHPLPRTLVVSRGALLLPSLLVLKGQTPKLKRGDFSGMFKSQKA